MRTYALASLLVLGGWISLPQTAEASGERDEAYRSLSTQRKHQIERLKEYREKGIFPLNHEEPDKPVYVFVGPDGELCAVANLIIQSGGQELVQRIAKENNHLRIADVTEGPVFDWILRSGLTKEECVLIQEPYIGDDDSERRRIQRHLSQVEETLLEKTEESLQVAVDRFLTTEELYRTLSAQRKLQIERVREYRERGVFPLNHENPGEPVFVFMGPDGELCAVANLVFESGGQELVRRIARENNHLRISDVTDGPVLQWILSSGLTKEECAFIQKPYIGDDDDEVRRIQSHLIEVEEKLIDEGETSLRIAVARALAIQS